MRNLYISLFISLLLCNSAISQEAWQRINPLPQENFINSMTMIPGTDRLMAVCDKSTIMTSDDGGESWQLSFNPAGKNNYYQCSYIYFINQNIGFITGTGESILKTTDGGETWQEKYSTNSELVLNEVEFLDDSTGFAIGYEGFMLKTTDQGENWLPVVSGTTFYLADIEFFDETNGIVACRGNSIQNGHILKTSDGGTTWQSQINPSGIPENYVIDNIHTLAENTILISAVPNAGSIVYIFKSTDNGNTWTEKYNLPGYTLEFASYDPLHSVAGCIAQAYQCKIVKTSDGGESWETIIPENFSWFSTEDICYYDSLTLLSVGSFGKYYKSYDGGSSWIRMDTHEGSEAIQDAQFIDDSTGYAIGEHVGVGAGSRHLMKTSDGGASWTKFNEHMLVSAFHFISADTGYLIDESYQENLGYTTDGGVTWTYRTIELEDYSSDFSIKFLNNNVGIITADDLIMFTEDAGNTWEECHLNTDNLMNYNDIEWLSSSNAFIVGCFAGDAAVLANINIDMFWLNEFTVLGMYGNANDIEFINDSVGFIGCSNNVILKTTNRGLSWNPTYIVNTEGFNVSSVRFTSQETGYATGNGQFTNMLKTTDGGNTWFPLNTKSTSGLNTMHFFDENRGYVFGQYGLKLYTNTGGVVGINEITDKPSTTNITIYPNPTGNSCFVKINQTPAPPEMCIIYDSGGRQVKTFKLRTTEETLIDMSSLRQGIYIFKVIFQDGATGTGKVIRY